MYVKQLSEAQMVMVCLYVDDLLVTGSDPSIIEGFKGSMKSKFDMTNLGILN